MKRPRQLVTVILAGICLLFSALCAAAGASGFTSSCPQSFRMLGTVNNAATFSVGSFESGERIRLKKGTAVSVLGREGIHYFAEANGKTGYIHKDLLDLTGEAAEQTAESISDTLRVENPIQAQTLFGYLTFSGDLRAPEAVDTLFLYIWDERALALEKALVLQLKEPSDTVSASVMDQSVNAGRLAGGRKTLVIQGSAGGKQYVLGRLFFTAPGREKDPRHITDLCKIPYKSLLDSNVESAWSPREENPSLKIEIPADVNAALLTLEWKKLPEHFTVILTGRNGEKLSETRYETGFYADSVALDEKVGGITVTPAGRRCALGTVRIYPEEYAAFAVQRWEPLPDKVDLLLFSAHQDDELLFFGGMIPFYCAAGKTVGVVYMADCGRNRYAEALDGLWTAGMKYHPVFMGWRDGLVGSINVAKSMWRNVSQDVKRDPLLEMVRVIRKYRPEVVVTHDFNGEYGHVQHILTAELISEAAVLAGDASCDPDSGLDPWEVKKVYIHLYEQGQIEMDWTRPPEDGTEKTLTPIFLAKEAYSKHRSQQEAFQMDKHGVLYDNRLFGLYFTRVGEDVKKDDLFENIP